MLELLSLHKGKTLTKGMIMNHLYSDVEEPEIKIIDVFVCKLRKKLAQATSGKNYIQTVWGRGYEWRQPTDEEPMKASAGSFESAESSTHTIHSPSCPIRPARGQKALQAGSTNDQNRRATMKLGHAPARRLTF
jgi:DNA-binding winged helix-turn-helix (wHTH) protein